MKQLRHKKYPGADTWNKEAGILVLMNSLVSEAGVTLVELMIALVIGMIITITVYATYVSQQRSFTTQDATAEINATKVALDMIANDIREAGFGVPNNDNLPGIQRRAGCSGINGFTQKIALTDNNEAEDQITLLGAYRQAGILANAVSSGTTEIVLKKSTDILNDSDKSYISIGGLSFSIVTALSEDKKILTLKSSTPIDKSYSADMPVYAIENVTYRVVSGQLRRVRRVAGNVGCTTNPDTDVIAENIEDLQFALIDTNADGVNDRVRVNILARTAREAPDFQGQGNPPSKIENREHAATNDGYRRRWWRMEVNLRNPQ